MSTTKPAPPKACARSRATAVSSSITRARNQSSSMFNTAPVRASILTSNAARAGQYFDLIDQHFAALQGLAHCGVVVRLAMFSLVGHAGQHVEEHYFSAAA